MNLYENEAKCYKKHKWFGKVDLTEEPKFMSISSLPVLLCTHPMLNPRSLKIIMWTSVQILQI